MDETKIILEKRRKLLEAIRETEIKKEKTILIAQSILKEFEKGRISKREYEEKIREKLEGRSLEKWIKYYDDFIRYYEYQIKLCDNSLNKKSLKVYDRRKIINKSKWIKILIILIAMCLIGVAILLLINFSEPVQVFFKDISESVFGGGRELAYGVYGYGGVGEVVPYNDVSVILDNSIQFQGVAGKPVNWKKEIRFEGDSGFNLKLPKESNIRSIFRINNGVREDVTSLAEIKVNSAFLGFFGEENVELNLNLLGKEYEVDYETPAPEIKEVRIISSGKKRVIIEGNDYVHYENILAYSEIVEKLRKGEEGKIKIYEIKTINGVENREEIFASAYDTDEDGFLDRIEWIVPRLSESVFEIIIEITNAEHLDSNKIFLSNIYDEVKKRDDVWSEKIYDNEYVRVGFAKKLNNRNDISVYARGEGVIEVYSYSDNKFLGEIQIVNNELSKFYLTELENEEEIFDLKIASSLGVEIDYIVDPAIPISNCLELQGIGTTTGLLTDYYYLVSDIDCSGVDFEPIGDSLNAFRGILDGRGNAIYNLNIDKESYNYVGLFAFIYPGAIVQNLKIRNADIVGKDFVGIVSGQNFGEIINCSVNGSVLGEDSVGGISGVLGSDSILVKGTILGSKSESNVFGKNYAGGLAGSVTIEGMINNSYAKGIVSNFDNYAGGLIGGTTGSAFISIKNSYFNGELGGTQYVGGLSGFIYAGNIKNSYAVGNMIGIRDVGGFIGKISNTLAYFQIYHNMSYPDNYAIYLEDSRDLYFSSHVIYDYWDFNGIWSNEKEGNDFPFLKSERQTSRISGCGKLMQERGNYILENNILQPASSNTCINISSDFINLDCNNYNIDINSLSYVGIGITSADNVQIENCSLIGKELTTHSGIKILNSLNSKLLNNSFYKGYYGIFFENSNFSNLLKNNFTSHIYSVYLYNSNDNNFTNNTIKDSTRDVLIAGSVSSRNNVFLNSSHSLSKEQISGNSELIRKEYYRAYVSDGGVPASDANVYVYQIGGVEPYFELISDASGYTEIKEMIYYIHSSSLTSQFNYYIFAEKDGKSDSHNYDVSVKGSNFRDEFNLGVHLPQISNVVVGSEFNPVSGGDKLIQIQFQASDADGDLDVLDAYAKFSRGGVTRNSEFCERISGNEFDGVIRCNVNLKYYDSPGVWNAEVGIQDSRGNPASDVLRSFNYNALSSIWMDSSALNWGVVNPGDSNLGSLSNPVVIHNFGNIPVSIQVDGKDLYGVNNEIFSVSSFMVSSSSLLGGCSGINLQKDVFVSIPDSQISVFSEGGVGENGYKPVYFCIERVPLITSQAYSTQGHTPWTILPLLSAVVLKKRKKIVGRKIVKREINRKSEEEKWRVLEEGNKRNEMLLRELLERVKGRDVERVKNKVDGRENIKEDILIPVSIFKKGNPAKSLCKYLKDEKGLKFSEIGKLIGRDERTVGLNYKGFGKSNLIIGEENVFIPIKVFNNRKLSILEGVVNYLRKQDYRNSEIALMIGRDARVIGTLVSRVEKKK